ncbi:MAG: putative secreted protein [Candidatus Phytoplasma cynodontis]|nr:MAG: putative secreted protein [Candidatus Phytoplasma cynodontis]
MLSINFKFYSIFYSIFIFNLLFFCFIFINQNNQNLLLASSSQTIDLVKKETFVFDSESGKIEKSFHFVPTASIMRSHYSKKCYLKNRNKRTEKERERYQKKMSVYREFQQKKILAEKKLLKEKQEEEQKYRDSQTLLLFK